MIRLFKSIFGENNNYHQEALCYLEFEVTVRKNDNNSVAAKDPIRTLKNASAFCFKEARLSTTPGSNLEHIINCGQISTILKVISIKNGDSQSQFDKTNEKVVEVGEKLNQIRDTSLQKMLVNNHTDFKKGKVKIYFCLEDIFAFCRSFEKVTKNLGFNFMSKTANLQDIIYTTM